MKPEDDGPAAGKSESESANPASNETNGWPPDWGPQYRFTPEELERFRQEVSEEELIALVRELEQSGGGYKLMDFLPELKQAAGVTD